jgi:hypothetical protein
MELPTQELQLETCQRPRHLRLSQWFDESRISYTESSHEHEAFRKQKAKRRLQQWRRKETDNYQAAPSSGKLAEAKRRHFTPEGKSERVAKALAALNEEPRILLTAQQWKDLVEDSDLEDQG